ncbi:MAG TPA: 30S ribosomal protein S13 [Candidatus Paceibacterota bacterium]
MRIAGITIPENKRIEIGLTAVYGIGRNMAHTILDEAKVSYEKKVPDITAEEEARIKKGVESRRIEGDLKREVSANVKRLKDIKSYRGNRHLRGLPTKGQRTKSNSRTVRGNVRKTMGSGKRKLEKK